MDLLAATRFNSIGRDLFELGNIKHELALIENERKKRLLALQSSHHGSSASEEKDGDTNEHKRISMRKVFAKVYRLARRFGRGFAIGLCTHVAFSIVPVVFKVLREKKISSVSTRLKSVLSMAQLRSGMFVGSFLVTFHATMRLLRNDKGALGYYRSLIAAALASFSLRFIKSNSARLSIGLFFFTRAVDVMTRFAASEGYLPAWAHGDVALMGLSSAQIIHSLLFSPKSLDPAYLKFLTLHSDSILLMQCSAYFYVGGFIISNSGLSPSEISGLGSALLANKISPPLESAIVSERGFKYAPKQLESGPSLARPICWAMHCSTSSCFASAIQFFRAEFFRAIPVYAPVYLVPFCVFKLHTLLRNPNLDALRSLVQNVLRSSFFLASYCTLGFGTVDFLASYAGLRHPVVSTCLSGLFAGSTLLLEKESRRGEIALSLIVFSFENAFWRYWNSRGYAPTLGDPGSVLFGLASMCILNVYSVKPALIRALYIRPLNFLFGSDFARWAPITKKEEAQLSILNLPALLRAAEMAEEMLRSKRQDDDASSRSSPGNEK